MEDCSGGVWHAVIRCSNEIAVWAVEFAVVSTSNHRHPPMHCVTNCSNYLGSVGSITLPTLTLLRLPSSLSLSFSSAGDGLSISVASNTMSENTNNITTASVNELFSNSSLLRMNAIIPELASTCTAAVSVLGEKGVYVVGDSASRVCVEVRSSEINLCRIVL